MTLTFDLLTLEVVSESRVTLATSVPILDFLGLSVLESRLRPDVPDRQTSDKSIANAPPIRVGYITTLLVAISELIGGHCG